MTLYRFLMGGTLRRMSPPHTTISPQTPTQNPAYLLPIRTFAITFAQEAAALRARRERRLRVTPLDANAPRLPESPSALVGPRLKLHKRVKSLIRSGDLEKATEVARRSVFSSNTGPTVFTCNAIMASMTRAKRYEDCVAMFDYFFNQSSSIVPNIMSYNFLMKAHCGMGKVDSAVEVYRHVIANAPVSPSVVTYKILSRGLINKGRSYEAWSLLQEEMILKIILSWCNLDISYREKRVRV